MGYWEEKRKFEETKVVNKCPKCKKGNMVVDATTKYSAWTENAKTKVFTSFCPLCGYIIRKESKI